MKCSAEMLDTLLNTLIRQLQNTQGNREALAEARLVSQRYG